MAGTRPTDRKASTVPWHREASTGHSHQSGIGTVDASLLTLHDQRSDCHRRVGRSRTGLRDRSNCETRATLWVPETPHTSRDLLILVEQPTEPVAPSDSVRLVRRGLGEWWRGACGCREPR